MLFSLTIVCILESKSMTCFLYLISKWFVMFSLVFFFVVLFFELLAYSSRILGNRKRVIALRNYSACFGRWLAILRLPNGVTQSRKLVMRQIGFVVLSAFMSLLEIEQDCHPWSNPQLNKTTFETGPYRVCRWGMKRSLSDCCSSNIFEIEMQISFRRWTCLSLIYDHSIWLKHDCLPMSFFVLLGIFMYIPD